MIEMLATELPDAESGLVDDISELSDVIRDSLVIDENVGMNRNITITVSLLAVRTTISLLAVHTTVRFL